MTALAELTGFADGPPVEPGDGVVERIRGLGAALGVDAMALLTERAAIWSYARNGRTSCGGATRLLATGDGWIALSLPRADDEDLVPAWIGCEPDWKVIEERIASYVTVDLVDRGRLLGLPIAALGERAAAALAASTPLGDAGPLQRPPVVVDLSSLWAGPLCTRLLRDTGARVIKVESKTRPDGARNGPAAFFDLMHAGKEFVSIDFTGEALRDLVLSADVVVEGSRPRALEQLGIDARDIVASGPRVWLSITGHGRGESQRNWVGFGDDAAVAGGLVAWWRDSPCFVSDAIADPLTGIAGAIAVLEALRHGGRWLIDCNLASVAAYVAGQ
ncbi:MAG: hypothetical protein QOI95_802 [Acidimicrobiaceae bacterium]|jgi:hypothetical protein